MLRKLAEGLCEAMPKATDSVRRRDEKAIGMRRHVVGFSVRYGSKR